MKGTHVYKSLIFRSWRNVVQFLKLRKRCGTSLAGSPAETAFYGTYVDDKGYIRISAGPFRGMRLHTLIAIAMNHKRLKDDQDVHHRKGEKLNPCPLCSLQVLGHKEHGSVSRAQHLYMLRKEEADRKEWEAIHGVPPPPKNKQHQP